MSAFRGGRCEGAQAPASLVSGAQSCSIHRSCTIRSEAEMNVERRSLWIERKVALPALEKELATGCENPGLPVTGGLSIRDQC
jgi:hypothetical protein